MPPPRWTTIQDEELTLAIDALPEEFRDVFVLHARGKSYQEIADQLGIPRATVGTRLARARKKLRETLGPAAKEGSP
jgi:RNA polymerase sigma-70 factor, ECF subfamily